MTSRRIRATGTSGCYKVLPGLVAESRQIRSQPTLWLDAPDRGRGPNNMSCRLLRLDIVVRLRRLGWWPWMLLIAWAFVAIYQEPALLRSFGTELCAQATWSGAVVVLLCLALLGEPHPHPSMRHSVYAAILLTSFVGLAQAMVALLADAALGWGHSWSEAARSWMLFVMVWTPACLGYTAPPLFANRSPVDLLLRTLPVLFSLTMATSWRDGLSSRAGVAMGLVTLGVILATARSTRAPAVGAPCA